MNPQRYQLDDLVQARAVAVVGASQDPTRIGGRPIAFLKDAGFAGAIYPVNAKYPEVQGLRAYADLDAVPGPVDVAIISVPARDVIAAIAACGRKGVKGAIVFSSGFAEVGAAGRAQQGELARVAEQAGVRIIGPNCQGLVALHQRLNLSFSSAFIDPGAPGAVGLVVQSGAVGGMLGTLLREHRILFTRAAGLLIVSMGIMELAGKGFRGLQVRIRKSETPLGTVLFGGVFALGWSACIGPVLASLLLMASTAGSALRGTALLFVYALGLASPLLLLSLWADRQSRIWTILKGRPVTLRIGRWRMETHSASLLSGALLILLGSLIFMDALYALNRLALQTPYVQRFLLGLEQWLTRWLL